MCGIVGTFNIPSPFTNISKAGHAIQHRGQDGAGAVFSDGEKFLRYISQTMLCITQNGTGRTTNVVLEQREDRPGHRTIGLIGDLVNSWPKEPRGKEWIEENALVGLLHLRYGTSGDRKSIKNVHPLVQETPFGELAVACNGDTPEEELRRNKLSLLAKGYRFYTSSDTELFPALISRHGNTTLFEALRKVLLEIKSAYALVMATPDTLIGCRDPHGFRPLSLGKLGDGYVLVSETCSLDIIGAEFIRDIKPGEIIFITKRGTSSYVLPNPRPRPKQCMFEIVYFGFPSSVMFGRPVGINRRALGEQLAKECKIPEDALIVPVPDSGNLIAEGIAHAIGRPETRAITRRHHTGRTFTRPGKEERVTKLGLKFDFEERLIRGKTLALVDDSIVRASTTLYIISECRKRGAKKIIMLVGCRPIRHPCRYGIDMKTYPELAAARHDGDTEAIRKEIGADVLHYLSWEGLRATLEDEDDLCYACLDGNYPL